MRINVHAASKFKKYPHMSIPQVLAIFAAAPELRGLIAGVEADYGRYLGHPKRRPEGPHAELLPWLAEQAQDWEAAALAGLAGPNLLGGAAPSVRAASLTPLLMHA